MKKFQLFHPSVGRRPGPASCFVAACAAPPSSVLRAAPLVMAMGVGSAAQRAGGWALPRAAAAAPASRASAMPGLTGQLVTTGSEVSQTRLL